MDVKVLTTTISSRARARKPLLENSKMQKFLLVKKSINGTGFLAKKSITGTDNYHLLPSKAIQQHLIQLQDSNNNNNNNKNRKIDIDLFAI